MFAYIYCVFVLVYICMHLSAHMCICIHESIHTRANNGVRADLYAKYTYKCMCILEHTHIHTRVHITACVCLREHLRPPPRRPLRMQLSLGVSN